MKAKKTAMIPVLSGAKVDVFKTPLPSRPGMPPGQKITAEVTLPAGWYTSGLSLYEKRGTQPPQLISSMTYESTDLDPIGTKEVWTGISYSTASNTKFIVEGAIYNMQQQLLTGTV